MADDIQEIRAFSRFYTGQIGLLEEQFADGPLSLPEARVLYEIDARGHTTGGELGRALGIDRGYLSRILRKFADAGLTALSPNPGDRRSNTVALTTDGDIIVERLNQRSDDAVSELIHRLDQGQRRELVGAMARIRRLLGDAPAEAPLILRPERLGELGWLVHRQGILYNAQFGWNAEFEGLIARIYGEYAAMPADGRKGLWIADRGDAVLGSIFVVPSEGRPGTAQLRMLYVEPEARGLGVGTALVAQAVAFARGAGYGRMRLWTQSILVSARRIYEAAGFRCVETAPHKSFGKELLGEHWELDLGKA